MSLHINRRKFLEGMALSAGAVALLKAGLQSDPVHAQQQMGAGVTHSFAQGGVTFHTYVSPAQAVHVTSHIVEFSDQLLMVDATMLPPTAQEVAALPDLELGLTEMSGVPVEFRHFQNTESFDMIVTVLPEQKVAIVQDLVYNGLYSAPGIDRANWIATLESLRDDPSFDTLLVGHGVPTTRGDLDHMIRYLKVMDNAISEATTPDEAVAKLKEAYPGQGGEFLLSLIAEYWQK